ncbi:ATP-binding protein [Xanthomonas campestris pv. raphani]|uniref:ATP-dependent nuclease n=1 Tax=Xanthomonas campestris TaxID=339 RepID=UPI00388EE78F
MESNGISFLAGGNNSGKSTLLQAIAVWEFCRLVLELERGFVALTAGYKGQGLGVSDDEFSPVAVASLKHLWSNLKTQEVKADNGYTLQIRCEWSDDSNVDKHLAIDLALANDRLFIKAGSTNLVVEDEIPTVAYLPTFAGISSRESRMSGAERRAMIGRGLAGGVIRNLLYDMYDVNEKERIRLKEGRTKIKGSDLAKLREEDPWEILQRTLATVFEIQLEIEPFNALYHTYIRVNTIKGKYEGSTFKRYPNYKSRDLMAEGSGFLQWLSVYALALSPGNKVILLDEPDAHLHPSLQNQLIEKLEDIAKSKSKQVLLATHSTEILKWVDHGSILAFSGQSAKYLINSEQRVSLFLGLGSEYAPKLDPLRRDKRLLIIENMSDERLLKMWAGVLGLQWPKNLVAWPWTGSSKERKQLFNQLAGDIPGLQAYSLRDRDDQALETIDKLTLRDKSISYAEPSLRLRVWRRRHIENYLLWPSAIARAVGLPLSEIEPLFAAQALVVPDDFTSRDVAVAMIDARGKELIQSDLLGLKKHGVRPEGLASQMTAAEVPTDVKTVIEEIIVMCKVEETAA